jgi:hypothetical protein
VMRQYIKTHSEFAEIGSLMLTQWQTGVDSSLRGGQ